MRRKLVGGPLQITTGTAQYCGCMLIFKKWRAKSYSGGSSYVIRVEARFNRGTVLEVMSDRALKTAGFMDKVMSLTTKLLEKNADKLNFESESGKEDVVEGSRSFPFRLDAQGADYIRREYLGRPSRPKGEGKATDTTVPRVQFSLLLSPGRSGKPSPSS